MSMKRTKHRRIFDTKLITDNKLMNELFKYAGFLRFSLDHAYDLGLKKIDTNDIKQIDKLYREFIQYYRDYKKIYVKNNKIYYVEWMNVMNDKLRIIDNLRIIIECDEVALSGKLICDCGCEHFYIFHSGKQTKGIFAPYLIKKDKQIVIKAVCKDCGKSILIYDSKIDGIKPLMNNEYHVDRFVLNNIKDSYEITLKYNYYKNDYKTNKFVECFIEIKNEDMKKVKQLYEG